MNELDRQLAQYIRDRIELARERSFRLGIIIGAALGFVIGLLTNRGA